MGLVNGIYRLPDHAVPYFGTRRDCERKDSMWGGVPWSASVRLQPWVAENREPWTGLRDEASLQGFRNRQGDGWQALFWEARAHIDGDGPSDVFSRRQLATFDSPGCYQPETSLQWRRKWQTADGDWTTHCDSRTFMGIVVPPEMTKLYGVRVGDFGLVCYGNTPVAAQVYDIGPRRKIGEMSVALARKLGIGHDPKRGNDVRDMTYLVFPGSRPDGRSHAVEANRQWAEAMEHWMRLTQRFQ